MSDADDGSASSSDSSTTPPWRAQGSGPPPEVVRSSSAVPEGGEDPDEPIPEWKKKFKAMKEHPKSSPSSTPAKGGDEEKEEPEWMKKFKTMKEKNPSLDESQSELSVKSEQQRPTAKPPQQDQSSLDDADLPEWKKKLKQFQAKHQDHPIEPTKPKATEKAEDIPEWKKKFNKMMHVDDQSGQSTPVANNQSQQPAQPTRATEPTVKTETSEDVPEWKRKLQEMEKRKSISETPPQAHGDHDETVPEAQPDAATQVEVEPSTESTDDVQPDDVYGSLDTREGGVVDKEIMQEGGAQTSGEQASAVEEIEEEIVYEEPGYYEEEIYEEVLEDLPAGEYEEIVEVDEEPTSEKLSPPQEFTYGAPTSNIQRPIPQPLQAEGNQFQSAPSAGSSFQAYQPRSESYLSSLLPPPPPPPPGVPPPPPQPPGAPPIHKFPASPDPPVRSSRRRVREESNMAFPEDVETMGSTVSVTDEEARFLEDLWENELRKDEETRILEEVWERELQKDAKGASRGTQQESLQKPLLLSQYTEDDKAEEDEENPPVFEDEYEVQPQEKYRRTFWENPIVMCCVCLIFLGLLVIAILLLLWLLLDDFTLWESDDRTPGPTMAPTLPFAGDLPTTPMGPYRLGQCQFSGLQPNIFSQCECDGQILTIQPNVRTKYEALRDTFILRIYPTWTLPIESCEPINQALLWLATSMASDDTDLLQKYTLALFYYQTNGPRWRSQENWLSDTDVCLWYGIACSNGLVTIIGLERNGVEGAIPWELSLLRAIQSLDLDRNNITGTMPGELFRLPVLQELSLSSNQVRGSIPFEVGLASNLEVFRLRDNRFSDAVPAELGRATSLEELDLGENDFSNAIPTDLSRLVQLTALNLEDNIRLTGRLPTEFGRFTDLEFFSISNTTIRANIPREFAALTKLTDLRMANTLVGGRIPEEIGVLSDLFTANLGDSRFRQTIPTILGNFRDMTVLLLNNNGLEGRIPSELGLLTKLTTLLLNGNDLSGTIPSEVGEISSLETLSLDMNPGLTGRIASEICELRSSNLESFIIDCPTRDQAPICPIPSCCTSCTRIPSS